MCIYIPSVHLFTHASPIVSSLKTSYSCVRASKREYNLRRHALTPMQLLIDNGHGHGLSLVRTSNEESVSRCETDCGRFHRLSQASVHPFVMHTQPGILQFASRDQHACPRRQVLSQSDVSVYMHVCTTLHASDRLPRTCPACPRLLLPS